MTHSNGRSKAERSGGDEKESVCSKLSGGHKVGIGVEGSWGSLGYVSWHCLRLAVACVWARRSEAEAHDHKGPTGGTQHWRHRSTCSEGDCRVPRRRNLLGQVRREEVPSALSTRAKKCGGACLAKGQKAAICASPLSSWATSRGRCPGVQEKFFPARRAHNMVLSWHHPGHL